MKILVKSENYNNIEIEIENYSINEGGYIISVFGRIYTFHDADIVDVITSAKHDTTTFILTDSAFGRFHAYYASVNVSKMKDVSHDELPDYSNDDIMYEVRRLRNEVELLKQDIAMLRLCVPDSNSQTYPYPQYPNIVYSSQSTTWTPKTDRKDDIIF